MKERSQWETVGLVAQPFADSSVTLCGDPKRLCKDVSDVGRWGNGDVEFGLSSIDELPYVIGLIRQSLDRQMGD